MIERSWMRFPDSLSDNLKSKTCTELSRSIQNPKLVGLVAFVLALTVCGARVGAQQAGKVPRISLLDNSTASGMAVLLDAFRHEMSKLGWIEGKNITIEYRFGEGKTERLPELAADFVRLKVDLIVTTGDPAGLAAKGATSSVPIVMANAGDPLGSGLVASLARPGGNVTGLSNLGTDLITKRLEVLKDAVPKLARVGLLRGVISPQVKALRPAAMALKLKLEEIEMQSDSKGLEAAFQTAKKNSRGDILGSDQDNFLT
jgi:putative ABC transport system substrate-binding protein